MPRSKRLHYNIIQYNDLARSTRLDAPCFAHEDSYDDDDVAEQVVSNSDRVEESLATEDDDEEDGEPMVTHAAARRSVQLLQRYFVE